MFLMKFQIVFSVRSYFPKFLLILQEIANIRRCIKLEFVEFSALPKKYWQDECQISIANINLLLHYC